MNGDENEKLCFQMFLNLIPDDIRKLTNRTVSSKDLVLRYPCFTNYCSPLNDSSFDKISIPVKSALNGDMRYNEFDGSKFIFSRNFQRLLSEIPDKHSMEVDSPELDGCFKKALPELEDKLLSRNEELSPREAISAKEACFESLSVPCLQSIQNLQNKCEKEGLKFNVCDSSEFYGKATDKTYAVDIIYSHKVVNSDIYYFVKWKNHTTTSNTWEPSRHLERCSEMIEYYHAMNDSREKLNKKHLTFFIRDLVYRKPYDIVTLTKVCALCFGTSENYVHSLKLTISQLQSKIKEILMFTARKLKKIEDKLLHIMQYREARKKVLINLKEWECDINTRLSGSAYVSVENQVDLETLPDGFKFINDYMNTDVSARLAEPVTFCSCEENCFKGKDLCCPNDSEGKFAYNRHKKLILEPGYPIFECNDRCNCPETCINRVVQHGQQVKVAIFRTQDKGWGLKAMENIDKGQFVLEYLGEIITSEAAETRGRVYDYVGRSYLFDLDYGIDNASCCYTVDAGHYGNVAHFINHSCDPNLHVFAVWINQQDPCLPRLAFFAKRKVYRGEELTFDYKMSKDRSGGGSPNEESDRILCRCNSKKCRKYLF